MKKSLISLIVMLFAIQLMAQRLPDQVQIRYYDTLRYLQNHVDFQYPSNTFALGFQWANGQFMTK